MLEELPMPVIGSAHSSMHQKVILTNDGMQIPEELTYEDWASVGQNLSDVVNSSAWWLGDWLVFGSRNFTDRYRHAVQSVGLSYQTLRNYAWVARRFPAAERIAGLSFQHHAEVASLPPEERRKWLQRAQKETLSTRKLRSMIKERPVPAGEPVIAAPRRVVIPPDRVPKWQQAAHQAGIDFHEWMITTLDQAAGNVLD